MMRTASPTATQLSKVQTHVPNALRTLISVCLLLALVFDADAQSSSSRLPKSLRISTPGTSATLLPDGQWLLLGGEDTTGAVTTARLYDPEREKFRALDTSLIHARAYHTATLLPDGQVLVIGGEGKDGAPVVNAELFDPERATFQALDNLGLIARTHHGATLLVDGRVLITGGSDVEGNALADAELFNPRSLQVERFNAKLETARLSHLATLLPNHHVLVWGGVDTDGIPVAGAELYDSKTQQFLPYDATSADLALDELNRPEPPTVVDSDPHNGATDVGIDKILSLRFSKPLLVTSINAETVVLIGPDGHTLVKVTPTEGGLVTFIRPAQELLPNANYTLIVRGAVDEQQQPLDWVTIGFKTQTLEQRTLSEADAVRAAAAAPSSLSTSDSTIQTGQGPTSTPSGDTATAESVAKTTEGSSTAAQVAANDDEAWRPEPIHWQGNWRTGRPLPEPVMALLDYEEPTRKHIERLRARHNKNGGPQPGPNRLVDDPTVTGIGGTVLKLNDQPLAEVTISIAQKSVRTDTKGRFEVTQLLPGHHEIVIDGRTVPGGREYLHVIFGVDIREKGLTELTHAIYLPHVRASDWVTVPSPTQEDTAIHHSDWPKIEILHVPKDTVFRDREGKILNRIALVPVPLDRTPYPTPVAFPVYFMLHPGGVLIQGTNTKGIQTIYPNTLRQPLGTEHILWFYDSRGGGLDCLR